MRIISRKTLKDFWGKHPDAEQPLKAWFAVVKEAQWRSFHDVKFQMRSASPVGNDRIVFNIKGNTYRLVAMIHFQRHIVFIRFIGTHTEYDRIDATRI